MKMQDVKPGQHLLWERGGFANDVHPGGVVVVLETEVGPTGSQLWVRYDNPQGDMPHGGFYLFPKDVRPLGPAPVTITRTVTKTEEFEVPEDVAAAMRAMARYLESKDLGIFSETMWQYASLIKHWLGWTQEQNVLPLIRQAIQNLRNDQ